MKLTRWFSGTLLTMAIGAVLGYVASTQIDQPLRAAVSEEPQTAVAEDLEQFDSALGASRSNSLSRSDEQTLLVNHNQAVTASAAQSGKKPNIVVI